MAQLNQICSTYLLSVSEIAHKKAFFAVTFKMLQLCDGFYFILGFYNQFTN